MAESQGLPVSIPLVSIVLASEAIVDGDPNLSLSHCLYLLDTDHETFVLVAEHSRSLGSVSDCPCDSSDHTGTRLTTST